MARELLFHILPFAQQDKLKEGFVKVKEGLYLPIKGISERLYRADTQMLCAPNRRFIRFEDLNEEHVIAMPVVASKGRYKSTKEVRANLYQNCLAQGMLRLEDYSYVNIETFAISNSISDSLGLEHFVLMFESTIYTKNLCPLYNVVLDESVSFGSELQKNKDSCKGWAGHIPTYLFFDAQDKTQKLMLGSQYKAEKYYGQGCFVATVVYSDAHAPQVATLRDFRDDVLAKDALGRAFVSLYYGGAGKAAAEVVKKVPLAVPLIRKGLDVLTDRYERQKK
jgi:hypothetical protein